MPLKLLKINNMGLNGLNTDVSPWELGPGFINSGQNFRVINGTLSSFGGQALYSEIPEEIYPGHLHSVKTSLGEFWLVPGRNAVWGTNGTNWFDASSGETMSIPVGGEMEWTSSRVGRNVVISNPSHYPEYWPNPSLNQPLVPLQFDPDNTWRDKNFQCAVMRSHKNFLIALNMRELGVEYGDTYRWSHPADNNGMPYTWDENDISSIAGRAQLGSETGIIIDGLSLRDSFAIYTEGGIDILDPTYDELVWRRRKLSNSAGILSSNCVVEIKGTHFVLTDGDIIRNDGSQINSIVHNRIRRRLNSRISPEYYNRAFVTKNYLTKELWFCIPEERSEYPTTAYIYNWNDDSWAIRDLPEETTFAEYGQAFIFSGETEGNTATWSTITGTWNDIKGPWGGRQLTPLDDSVVSTNIDNTLRSLEPSVSESDIPTQLHRSDYPLEDHRSVTSIARVFPHMTGSETVTLRFGSQDHQGAPIRWKAPVQFNPSTDRKIDIRTTGELHAWEITSNAKGAWHISGMDIEYSNNGER